MIIIIVKGRLGNQLFHLALALHLINKGHVVKLRGTHIRLFRIFSTIKIGTRKLSFNSTNSYLHYIKISLIRTVSSILSSKIKNTLRYLLHLDNKKDNTLDLVGVPNLIDARKKNNQEYLSPGTYHEIVLDYNAIDLNHLKFNPLWNYTLDGYWQQYDLAQENIDILKSNYKSRLVQHVKKKYSQIIDFSKLDNIVAVHIRGGDYVGKKHFDITKKKYYDKSFRLMNSIIGPPIFVFFTDDLSQLYKLVPVLPDNSIIISEYTRSDIHDFILMTQLKNFIISNSTFSWWAALLSDYDSKTIIRPKEFFHNVDDKLHNSLMIEL